MAEGPARSKSAPSIDTPAAVVGRALRGLFALLDDCFAILSLRSAAWLLTRWLPSPVKAVG